MINAIDGLFRKWREREAELLAVRNDWAWHSKTDKDVFVAKTEALAQCIEELRDTVTSVEPAPLNEASTQKLYRWASRLVAILDLAISARDVGDEVAREIGHELGDLADQQFLNEVYDLFKQLANRQSGA